MSIFSYNTVNNDDGIDAVSDDEWLIPCKYFWYVPQESGAVTVKLLAVKTVKNGKREEISNWQGKKRGGEGRGHCLYFISTE